MEYEIVLKIKVDSDYFYWDLTPAERQDVISKEIHNIIYDTDELTVTRVTASELDK